MPKVKTHKGSAKRFRVTASGRVVTQRANRRHNSGKRSSNRMRRLRLKGELTGGDAKRALKLMPYA